MDLTRGILQLFIILISSNAVFVFCNPLTDYPIKLDL